MSQINLKSITGITSITTPAGVDNVFTVHSNDTTERFRVDSNGNQVIAGILTVTQDLNVDGHINLDNVSIVGVTTLSNTGANQLVIKDSDTSGDAAHMRISFQDSGGTEKFFVGNDNSNGWLYLGSPSGQNNNIAFRVNGSDKFQVNYSGAYVNGALTVNGNVDILDSIIHTGDTNTKIRFPTNDQISFETNGSEQMKVAGTNITLGTNSTTGHILQIKNRGNDCNNTVALGLDIQAAWIRIGDALSGGQTYGNGLGIKFHDSGVVHWSVGTIGSGFYISNTSNSGTQLFPSSRTDALVIASGGNATFSNNVTVSNNLTVDTNTLYVSASNNRIVINTTIPSKALDVVGSGEFSSALTVGGALNASGTCTLGQTVSINGTNPQLQFVDSKHNP